LLRGGFNITNQAQKTDSMQNHFAFLELNDDYVWLQQCFQDAHVKNQAFFPLDDNRKDNELV